MADERHEWFLNQIFRHREALHRYLWRFTSGAEDIEDLVQETYVRVYALPDYHAVESSKALLFRIAHNLAVERALHRCATPIRAMRRCCRPTRPSTAASCPRSASTSRCAC